MTTKTKRQLAADRARIAELGGVSAVAGMLGCSIQRVQNWLTRGIPSDAKLERPDLFLYGLDAMGRK